MLPATAKAGRERAHPRQANPSKQEACRVGARTLLSVMQGAEHRAEHRAPFSTVPLPSPPAPCMTPPALGTPGCLRRFAMSPTVGCR